MTYKDRTFCSSPSCENKCGRKLTEKDKFFLAGRPWYPVSYQDFCSNQESTIVRTEEEILEWIREQQDFLEKQMDNCPKKSALFNQFLGSFDILQTFFEFITERD